MVSSQTSEIPQQDQIPETDWIEVGRKELAEHLKQQGRLKHLLTLMGANWLNQGQKRQAYIENSENEWYRGQMGLSPAAGNSSGGVDDDDDGFDMKNVQLGDTIHPAPVVFAPPNPPVPQSNGLQTALMTAMLAGTTGIAGYLLAGGNEQPEQPPVSAPVVQQEPAVEPVALPDYSYESMQVGLGKIEDYIKPGG